MKKLLNGSEKDTTFFWKSVPKLIKIFQRNEKNETKIRADTGAGDQTSQKRCPGPQRMVGIDFETGRFGAYILYPVF